MHQQKSSPMGTTQQIPPRKNATARQNCTHHGHHKHLHEAYFPIVWTSSRGMHTQKQTGYSYRQINAHRISADMGGIASQQTK
jgi:hypothetical protein